MRRVRWLGLGLGLLACSSSKLTGKDGGGDAISVMDMRAVDRAVDHAVDRPVDRSVDHAVDGPVDRPVDHPASDAGAGGCSESAVLYTEELSYRHTMAWTFSAAASDAGAPVPDAGATGDAASVSRCVASGSAAKTGFSDYTCRGGARLRSGTAGPILTFDDGSTLTWNPSSALVSAPYVTASGGDRVWVSYQLKGTVICPVCGAYTNQWLEVRDGSSTGTIRHYAQQGNHLTSPLDLATQMFGVAVTENAECQVHAGPCPSFDRTAFGHQVTTTPVQTIPFATLTEVTSTSGSYDVLWAATSESNVQYPTTCGTDQRGASNDDGFAATRRAP
jgi:hypothetical protein